MFDDFISGLLKLFLFTFFIDLISIKKYRLKMIKKGIILAGGHGSRLSPLTLSTSKQLLPVYDKPMIYYPLSILMLAGIRDILIIVKKSDKENFKKTLSDGKQFGIKISYLEQKTPKGLPDAFILGKKFINKQKVMLILGDNLFYGRGFGEILNDRVKKSTPTIFLKDVRNPSSFGVAKIINKKITTLIEKPKKFVSNLAISGLYIFDEKVSEFASQLSPSKRGELEIIELIKLYHNKKKLDYQILGRGLMWIDNGQIKDLNSASNFIRSVQELQNVLIGYPEEIAYQKKWINIKQLNFQLNKFKNSEYGLNLKLLLKK